jgi:hypothetical protein
LISENRKVLGSLYPNFKAWIEQEQKRRENAATKRANSKEKGGDWMSIFDAGDAAIHDNLGAIGQKKSSSQPPKR